MYNEEVAQYMVRKAIMNHPHEKAFYVMLYRKDDIQYKVAEAFANKDEARQRVRFERAQLRAGEHAGQKASHYSGYNDDHRLRPTRTRQYTQIQRFPAPVGLLEHMVYLAVDQCVWYSCMAFPCCVLLSISLRHLLQSKY